MNDRIVEFDRTLKFGEVRLDLFMKSSVLVRFDEIGKFEFRSFTNFKNKTNKTRLGKLLG